MQTLSETPDLRWFNPYPRCRICGKRPDGVLMSVRNESYGEHCQRCADKRLKASKSVREQIAREKSA